MLIQVVLILVKSLIHLLNYSFIIIIIIIILENPQNILLLPGNINNSHWVLIIIDLEKSIILVVDSKNLATEEYFKRLQLWLEYKYLRNFTLQIKHIMSQRNGYDCGPFGNKT